MDWETEWPIPYWVGSRGSPSVWGGPRHPRGSFGLCWNSGQNDLHIGIPSFITAARRSLCGASGCLTVECYHSVQFIFLNLEKTLSSIFWPHKLLFFVFLSLLWWTFLFCNSKSLSNCHFVRFFFHFAQPMELKAFSVLFFYALWLVSYNCYHSFNQHFYSK